MEDNNRIVGLVAEFRSILLECLQQYVAVNPQVNMDSPSAQENLATFLAAYMAPTLEEYEDEIHSLRFMLDEMNNSREALKSPELAEELNTTINNQLLLLKMMQNNRGDA